MKDVKLNNTNSSEQPKKRGRKPKPVEAVSKIDPVVEPVSAITPDDTTRKAINELLQNSVDKYTAVANNQIKETRDDFECLQPIVSEFLENYIIIGHSLDGQRVVSRYTTTPAGLDGLNELCKKVLVRLMVQEQSGQ